MPLRVIGYDGTAYRAQLLEDNCYPVITLVLYFGNDRWGKNYSLYDAIAVPEEFRPFVNDYKINVFEIAHLPEEAIGYFHSDFKIVVDYFVHRRTNPDYRPTDPIAFKHVDEVLKMLTALTHDDRYVESLEGEAGKPMAKQSIGLKGRCFFLLIIRKNASIFRKICQVRQCKCYRKKPRKIWRFVTKI